MLFYNYSDLDTSQKQKEEISIHNLCWLRHTLKKYQAETLWQVIIEHCNLAFFQQLDDISYSFSNIVFIVLPRNKTGLEQLVSNWHKNLDNLCDSKIAEQEIEIEEQIKNLAMQELYTGSIFASAFSKELRKKDESIDKEINCLQKQLEELKSNNENKVYLHQRFFKEKVLKKTHYFYKDKEKSIFSGWLNIAVDLVEYSEFLTHHSKIYQCYALQAEKGRPTLKKIKKPEKYNNPLFFLD